MSALDPCRCYHPRFYHLMGKPQACLRVGCPCKAFKAAKEEEVE